MTKFAIEGREYEYDGKITVADAMFIFEKSQVGVTKMAQALFVEGNPNAIAAWMYILKRRAGEAVRWEDLLGLDIRTYQIIPDEDEQPAEAEKPRKSDPTEPNGKTRRRASTNT